MTPVSLLQLTTLGYKLASYRKRMCADTIGTVSLPCAGHFQCQNINTFFQIKCTEAILSNRTQKLLRLEITKMLTAVQDKKFIVLFIIISGTLLFPITD